MKLTVGTNDTDNCPFALTSIGIHSQWHLHLFTMTPHPFTITPTLRHSRWHQHYSQWHQNIPIHKARHQYVSNHNDTNTSSQWHHTHSQIHQPPWHTRWHQHYIHNDTKTSSFTMSPRPFTVTPTPWHSQWHQHYSQWHHTHSQIHKLTTNTIYIHNEIKTYPFTMSPHLFTITPTPIHDIHDDTNTIYIHNDTKTYPFTMSPYLFTIKPTPILHACHSRWHLYYIYSQWHQNIPIHNVTLPIHN